MTTNVFTTIEEMKNQIILYQRSLNPIKKFLGYKYKKKLKVILNKFKGADITYDLLYIFIDFALSNNIKIKNVSMGKLQGINMNFPYMIIDFDTYSVKIELSSPSILLNIVFNDRIPKYEGTMIKYDLYQRMYTESESYNTKLIDALNLYISDAIYNAMIVYINTKEIKLYDSEL